MSFREVEVCDICEKQIGAEGGIELLEGCMCQACAGKLSPWFEDYDCAEIDEIKDQLSYREDNRVKVRNFQVTRQFGETTKIAIDDNAKCFMVMKTENPEVENPDVISFEDVIDCTVTAVETKEKLDQEDQDGHKITRYTYDFELEIDLDHDFIDHIVFNLNQQPLILESSERSFLGFGGFDPEEDPVYARYMQQGERISDILNELEEE